MTEQRMRNALFCVLELLRRELSDNFYDWMERDDYIFSCLDLEEGEVMEVYDGRGLMINLSSTFEDFTSPKDWDKKYEEYGFGRKPAPEDKVKPVRREVVYVIHHEWFTDDSDGSDVEAVFAYHSDAVDRMKEIAKKTRELLQKNDPDIQFHEDFENWGDDYISFGYYGNAYVSDEKWAWRISAEEVVR